MLESLDRLFGICRKGKYVPAEHISHAVLSNGVQATASITSDAMASVPYRYY